MLKVTQKVLKNIKKQTSWWMSTGHQGNEAFSCIYDVPFGERRSPFCFNDHSGKSQHPVGTLSEGADFGGKASGERGAPQVLEQRSLRLPDCVAP